MTAKARNTRAVELNASCNSAMSHPHIFPTPEKLERQHRDRIEHVSRIFYVSPAYNKYDLIAETLTRTQSNHVGHSQNYTITIPTEAQLHVFCR